MNLKKTLIYSAAVAVLALTLGACGKSNAKNEAASGGSAEGGKVVFVPKVTGNSFFESGNLGAQEIAKKEGFTVDYQGNSVASVANQVTIINNAVQTGAGAIAISSVDPTGLDNALKQAQKAGLKVVTWDSDVSPDARSLMVSQGTPEQLGEMLVKMSVDGLEKRGKDPKKDKIKYAWHYSSSTVQDQNSWQKVGEEYIKKNYPNWENVNDSNYYSNQDAQQALNVGQSILSAHKDIDLIICNDSTALPGQLQAVQNEGKTKSDITVTGFSTPNSIKKYAKDNIIEEWGLWDVKVQGALAVYLANQLASGKEYKVGDKIDVPGVGEVEVQNNSVLDPNYKDSKDSGVVLLPERTIFSTENMDNFDF